MGVHDEFLDAVPCGYDKESPDPNRPRWQRGGMQMIGWLVALVYNAVADLAETLGPDHAGSHVQTMHQPRPPTIARASSTGDIGP